MRAGKAGFFSVFLWAISLLSHANDNEITFKVPTNVQQNEFGRYTLLLPVIPRFIDINTTFILKNTDKTIPAQFSFINTWPSIQDESNKLTEKFIRLLLIEIPDIKSLPTELTLIWRTIPNINKANAKPLAQSFTTKPENMMLVYPSASWLAKSVLLHLESEGNNTWYLAPQKKYANYVTDLTLLTEKGHPPSKPAQWLYDRPQAIYQLFIMSGEKEWLVKADQLIEIYLGNVNEDGSFKLKEQFDPKYLMPKGLLYRYLLSGDENAKTTLKRIFERSLDWDESYSLRRGFWTERNQAAALNVAVSYWELTGELAALKRINDIIDATVAMTFHPSNDWPLRGCPQHSFKSHEGWGDDSPACSPWMMALLGDALWRFYLLTGDNRAGSLIDAFGDFVLNYGIYYGNARVKNIVIPKYIVSIENPQQEELNQWTDPQHACDIAALLGKSTYIKKKTDQDDFIVKTLFSAFLEQCEESYAKLKKEQKNNRDKSYWELKPLRRFGWMYSTTSDLPWLQELLLNDF